MANASKSKLSEAFHSKESRLFSSISVTSSVRERHTKHDLTNEEVATAVRNSDASDWLYIPEDETFSYRANLLIHLEKSSPENWYALHFGAHNVGQVEVVKGVFDKVSICPASSADDSLAESAMRDIRMSFAS